MPQPALESREFDSAIKLAAEAIKAAVDREDDMEAYALSELLSVVGTFRIKEKHCFNGFSLRQMNHYLILRGQKFLVACKF
jgi:hypothetical protein